MISAHVLPCASCCAVCDVLAITSSVRRPSRSESLAQEQLLYFNYNAIGLSTSKQCLEQKLDGHTQHVL